MECQNAAGSFHCSCSYGYKLAGDGRSCVAECPSGYRKHSNPTESSGLQREHCTDIDECQEPGPRQRRCEWRCVNLPGSHRCMCPRGYRLDPDAYHCQDINECNSKNGGCSHICINYKGGFQCACPEHYRFAPYSRKKCQPVKT
nr:PREDICTED: fibulin-1-like [Lepisosteus oculatus]